MDTVTAFAPRRPEPTPSVLGASVSEAPKTLAVTVTYLLSEEGRKASLLAGGDGRARQELTVDVPANRLHLVTVDLEGVARLKLRPRYEIDAEQRVRRIDEMPTYDVPPAIDDLFKDAARNHQLERTYEVERRAIRDRRREAGRAQRDQVAQMFLTDPAQRALVHPAPTPKRCYIATETGRVVFDVATEMGSAREVPPEAHRRFRADLRARRDRNLQERAGQLALHEEKKRVIAEWIAAHGTPDQRVRQADGVLPMEEAIEAMTDRAFEALADRPRYVHDGVSQLQTWVRQIPEHREVVVTRQDVVVTSANATQATAAQWMAVKGIQALLPGATVTLRIHRIAWRRDPRMGLPPVFGIVVTQRVEPFTFRREYVAPYDAEGNTNASLPELLSA
ncbi:MAG: hypothetical protein AB7L71_00385 [Vicinamibacterales bacterium]